MLEAEAFASPPPPLRCLIQGKGAAQGRGEVEGLPLVPAYIDDSQYSGAASIQSQSS